MDIVTSGGRRARWLRPIDFTRPTKFTPDQERRLRRAHETFCRLATHAARRRARIADRDRGHRRRAAHVGRRARAAASGPAVGDAAGGADRLEDPAVHRAAARSSAASSACSAAPAESQTGERPLTDIDLVLVGRIFDAFVESLSATWDELAGVQLERLTRRRPQRDGADRRLRASRRWPSTMEARMQATTAKIVVLLPHRSVAAGRRRLLQARRRRPRGRSRVRGGRPRSPSARSTSRCAPRSARRTCRSATCWRSSPATSSGWV